MTPEQLCAIVNHSLRVAKEVAALPVKTELAIHRALVAAKAANEALDAYNAQRDAWALIERAMKP